jgi:cobalt-zinc-cadmium efflux system outer membrane protein
VPIKAQSINDELRQRTGFVLPENIGGDSRSFSLPPGVTTANTLTARDAVAIALWNNSAFQADLANLEVSRADLVEAALFKNPSLSSLLPVGPKPFEFLLAWPLEELWQRKQRVKAAQLSLDAVATGLVQNGLQLMRDVKSAHADLWLAASRATVLQESAELRARIATFSERRRDAGDGTGLDVSLSRADSQSAAALARIAEDEVGIAASRLRHVLGMRGQPQAIVATFERTDRQPLPTIEFLLETAASSRPDLRAAEINVNASAERAKWQRSQVLALLAPTLSIKEVGDAGLRAGPGLNMDIPILSRNQGRISRADAEVVRAARQYAALKDRIEQEVLDAYGRYRQAEASLARIAVQVRPAADQAIQLSQRAFENGDVVLLTVLEATKQKFDIDLREVEALASLERALADLERAIGRSL